MTVFAMLPYPPIKGVPPRTTAEIASSSKPVRVTGVRIQKEKQNSPEVLKVCLRDCFIISTPGNTTANPRYGFGPSSEVT
jgi:hypothetical protein